MEREESIRRSSEEAKRVNFSGDITQGKELVKRDRERIAKPQSPEKPIMLYNSGKQHRILVIHPLAWIDVTLDCFRERTGDGSPKTQKKFVSTWKMACDKTKDRTKELLKKWRTMPEEVGDDGRHRGPLVEIQPNSAEQGWSVHVWATWVKRFPSDEDQLCSDKSASSLTTTQKEKLGHFFAHIFDMDRDDIISLQDFESFTERIRHFADWSTNSGEFLVLEQVQQGFIEMFIYPLKPETTDVENAPPFDLNRVFLSIEEWLWLWSCLLQDLKSITELPIWLQYFPKVIFQAINRSGSGVISRDEMSAFYSSVMGYSAQKVGEIIDQAYKVMTANGDHKLDYSVYRLCFGNFIFGRFPNGPGQYLFGCVIKEPSLFPIDYSAMNSDPEDLECYSADSKSNRRSVVV